MNVLTKYFCAMQKSPKSAFSPTKISPKSRLSQGKNLTGNPRLVRDLAADIHASIQHWNVVHLNGISILKVITFLKVDETYPDELKQPCKDLEQICDEIDKIVDNLSKLTSQMKAVSRLQRAKDYLFNTWPIEKFVSTAEMIYDAYKEEAKVKRIILENVAHGYKDSWKMLHLATWVHQTQIPDNIATKLESMLIESELR